MAALTAAGLLTGRAEAGDAVAAWAGAHSLKAASDAERLETHAIISEVSRARFKSEWRAYRASFIAADGRVIDNGNGGVSHSEGQGYGLILAALADDREAFDLIWGWTEKRLRVRADALFAWRWDAGKEQVSDKNNATDGDILIAWGLAEGARRFARPDYLAAAKTVAQAIGAAAIQVSPHGPVLLPGAAGFSAKDQSDGPIVNLSYWVYPAFPTLKELAPEYDWDGVRASGLKLLNDSRFGPLRLPADWQSAAGAATAPAKNFAPEFGYNAIRIPLYLAWSGDDAARRALRRFAGLGRGSGDRLAVVDVASGVAAQPLEGAGYQLIVALARCATFGQPVEGDLLRARDALYYPATLRLLSLTVIQQRFPQCL
ncbi:MAG: hypothetical protein JO107_09345 [Hyphomicrobiales bacterium]|nr:hypothetical protein [Hyphomicrobiales bacterium]MBV8663292.1 hypothetical protein [Hyphomicrobiales bacterium]